MDNKEVISIVLRPCPFCGSKRILVTKPTTWQSWCIDCKAIGPYKVDKQDAIEAWNRRSADERNG